MEEPAPPKRPKRPNQTLTQKRSTDPLDSWSSVTIPSFESEILSIELDTWLKDKKKDVKEVPSTTFKSTQHYAQVFLPLILFESVEDSHNAWTTKSFETVFCVSTTLERGQGGKETKEAKKRKGNELDHYLTKQPKTNEPPNLCATESQKVKTVILKFFYEVRVSDRVGKQIVERNFAEMLQVEEEMCSRKVIGPCSILSGDLLVLSTTPKHDSGLQAIALVQSSPVFTVKPPRNSDESYHIQVKVEAYMRDPNALSHLGGTKYVARLGNLTTGMREYNGLASLLKADSISNPLLGSLLTCKDVWNSYNSQWFKPLDEITGLSKTLFTYIQDKFNRSQQKAIFRTVAQLDGFSLIQGPPGTGKTTTILMLLNLLHLSILTRYHDNLVPPLKQKSTNKRPEITTVSSNFFKNSMPHILVTAPSNTAVDGMVSKILQNGFLDGSMNRYNPRIVRVGSRSSGEMDKVELENLTENVMKWLAGMNEDDTKRELAMREQALKLKIREIEGLKVRVDQVTSNIKIYDEEIARIEAMKDVCKSVTSSTDDDNVRLHRRNQYFEEYMAYAGAVVKAHDEVSKIKEGLEFIRAKSAARTRQRVREILLENAHIVFVTLSSSALGHMINLGQKYRFEVLLVDEAGQATEPSILVPLQHGIRHCVLVGDPKQLPATVKSSVCQNNFLQQSLFERLQKSNHLSFMLDVQYRCNPKISAFPSSEFYHGKLKDAEGMENNILEISKDMKELQPLTFFDLQSSRAVRQEESFINPDEVRMVTRIYDAIRKWEQKNSPGVNRTVGVITPYRQQARMLEKAFSRHRNYHVSVGTVDGYQGKEFDIIIFSCVRATDTSGDGQQKKVSIGFLNDQRRLNVAITRAKYMLLVVGHTETLLTSPLWKKFIKFVKAEGTFLRDINTDHKLV